MQKNPDPATHRSASTHTLLTAGCALLLGALLVGPVAARAAAPLQQGAETAPPTPPDLVSSALPITRSTARALSDELSGEIAMHHLRAITRFHRIQASPMMGEAARYVRDQLEDYGYTDAAIESFPSDGRKSYQTWLSPVGWTVEGAELWMVAPHRERLARFAEIADNLITLSTSTDTEGVLVDAGTGTEAAFYDTVDVAGKIVLASGYGGDVHRMAVLGHGALGVVCWNDAPDHPDQVRYTGMWPKAGERERVKWGFNLSYREGQRLKRLLASGQEVRLHAVVSGGVLQDGSLDLVQATLRGRRYPEQEILLMAHLDHPRPSANDNASGSSALLDIARGLRRLVADGTIPPPDRTIRFLWVPEMFGTAAWLDAHPDVGERTAFAINLDMVGTPPALSVLRVVQAPASAESILDGVTAEAARWVASLDVSEPRGTSGPMNYRVVPYSGGSDHYMVMDGAVGVPAVMLNTEPDPYYHSSEDTPDKIDPTTLKRSELIAAAAALALADLVPDEADDLLQTQVAEGLKRLNVDQEIVVSVLETLSSDSEDVDVALQVRDAGVILEAQLDREMHALESLMRLAPGAADSAASSDFQRAVTRARAQLEAHGQLIRQRVMEVELNRIASDRGMLPLPQLLPIAPLPERDEAVSLVYARTTRGPINDDWLLSHLPEERRSWYLDGPGRTLWADTTLRYEITNFVNGSRTALDIRNAVSAEFGPMPLERVVGYLKDLAAAGLLRSATAAGRFR